jgi:hypothetical protein
MADLSAFLASASLSHLAPVLASETLPSLETRLEESRSAFLNYLKSAGVTALKDRQSLTNGIAKAKRERESGVKSTPVAAAPPPSKQLKKYVGPNADCDLMGTRRGAHVKGPQVCPQFAKIHTTNENDLSAFNCFVCGKPATEHVDLGPAPLEEYEGGDGEEFDISKFAVDGRSAFSDMMSQQRGGAAKVEAKVEPKRNEPTHEVTAENLAMFEAGTDPLAAVMQAADAQAGTAEPLDPLASLAGAMGAASVDVSDPLGLGQMERAVPPPAPPAPPAPSAPPAPPAPSAPAQPPPRAAPAAAAPVAVSSGSGGLSALALKIGLPAETAAALAHLDPSALRASLATPDGKAAVDAALKSGGVKSIGQRLKLVSAILESDGDHGTAPPAAASSAPAAPAAPAPAAPAAATPPPATSDDPLELARAKGSDVAALRALAAAGDRDAVSARLRSDGIKTGLRLKIEAALFPSASTPSGAPATPPPAAAPFKPFQVDLFGVKRGQGLRDLSCARYEAKVVALCACAPRMRAPPRVRRPSAARPPPVRRPSSVAAAARARRALAVCAVVTRVVRVRLLAAATIVRRGAT